MIDGDGIDGAGDGVVGNGPESAPEPVPGPSDVAHTYVMPSDAAGAPLEVLGRDGVRRKVVLKTRVEK